MKQTTDRDLVTIHVGKDGLKESLITEIRLILKKRKYARVKFLKSFMDGAKESFKKKALFLDLASKTQSRIERSAGFVVILKK